MKIYVSVYYWYTSNALCFRLKYYVEAYFIFTWFLFFSFLEKLFFLNRTKSVFFSLLLFYLHESRLIIMFQLTLRSNIHHSPQIHQLLQSRQKKRRGQWCSLLSPITLLKLGDFWLYIPQCCTDWTLPKHWLQHISSNGSLWLTNNVRQQTRFLGQRAKLLTSFIIVRSACFFCTTIRILNSKV